MKPGYKTTEFWLTVLANVVGILLASGQFAPGSVVAEVLGVVAVVLSNLGYTYNRAKVKAEDSRRNGHAGNAIP